MISADAGRTRAGSEHFVQLVCNALERVFQRKWVDGKIAVVPDPPLRKGIDIERGIPGPNDARLLAHMARTEARAGTIRGTAVIRNADQRDV